MHKPVHHFGELCAQLGLPGDDQGIQQFLDVHGPLEGHIELPEASFWSPAQASFLRDALIQDADWTEVVDPLSETLRGSEGTIA
jgi:Protein of unknown function (DUF2789)